MGSGNSINSLTITDKISSLVETANRDPSATWRLRGWDRVFALRLDGTEIYLEASGGRASVSNQPSRRADGWFALTERTFDMLIAGSLSPLSAKLSGHLRSGGRIADILRFASVFIACLRHERDG